MNRFKVISFFLLTFFLFNSAQAFTDKEGKGAQSDGREDLSFLKAKNSNFKKGKDALKQALKYEKKGKIKKANKRLGKALKYFVSAYNEYPNNVEIINFLGFTYNKIGDFIMTEIYYKQGLSIDPNNILINKRLGELYINTQRLELAKERLNVLSLCNCEEYINLKKIIDRN